MSLAPRNWANALFLWLSLATVLVPAIGSSGSPLRPTEGSAFSAFTSDVSLGPSRAAPIEDRQENAPDEGDGAPALTARAGLLTPRSGPAIALSSPRNNFVEASSHAPVRFTAGAIGARAPPVA